MNDVLSNAGGLAAQGKFAEAQNVLEAAIRVCPTDGRLHSQLGACFVTANQLHLAQDCFREAVRLDPSLAVAHAGLGAWYLVHGMVDLALQSSSAAIALAPKNFKIALSHARILETAGQIDAAWDLVQQLIKDGVVTPPLVRLFGRMARYRNQQSAALAMALKLIDEKRSTIREQASLHFTAGDLLDSVGEYDRAFTHVAMGNALTRPRYDPAVHQRTVDLFIEYFTPQRMSKLARSTETSNVPVFIVGMPRSGTSLVEQILASHPQIYGGGELEFMGLVSRGTVAMLATNLSVYPHCLDHLTVDQATGMAQIYLQPLIAMSPGSARITDKLPLNFLHLGLINRLMPGARVIHCRRDAGDTCLSCYMNLFTSGNNFKFDLRHLGLFYRQYQRLMTHWCEVLEVSILDVDYENLVSDPQPQIQRMLSFLELPYDSVCIDFHRTERPVLSSSIEQVRQPLYGNSVGRWKHYEKYLGPLFEALGL